MKKLVAVIAAVMMMVSCVSAFAAGHAMTKDEAMKAALDFAGLKADQVTYSTVHKDYDDGRQEWDIKIVSGGIEYEFEIDIATGRIRETDRDYFDRYDDDYFDRYDRDYDDDFDDWFDFD